MSPRLGYSVINSKYHRLKLNRYRLVTARHILVILSMFKLTDEGHDNCWVSHTSMNAFKSSEEMSSDILQDDKITTERWLNNYGEMTRWLKRAGKIEMTKASWLKWDTKNGGSTVLCLRLRSLTCGITHCISLYGACAIHVLIGFIVNGFIQSKCLKHEVRMHADLKFLQKELLWSVELCLRFKACKMNLLSLIS